MDSKTDITALQAQLKEKDALVAALTERLEQAAEKLDRVHRTGGDRGLRMGAIPPELIEQQLKLTEELQQAVQRWEDAQAVATLGRIEVQVTELRDLVANGLPAGGFAGAGGGGAPAGGGQAQRGGGGADAGRGGSGGSGFSGWEALKAGLMKSDGGSAPPVHSQAASAAAAAAASGAAPAESRSQPEEESVVINIEEVPPPEPIDVAAAGVDALRAAVERRDEYVTYLTRKLRLANGRQIRIPDWESLNNAPEDLKARLLDLEKQLDENLRLAEVELSLERARLAREAARLRLQQDQIEKELKRLKLDRPQAAVAGQPGDADNPAGRRWLRMLGMGKGADEE
jgi:hypothetical protein